MKLGERFGHRDGRGITAALTLGAGAVETERHSCDARKVRPMLPRPMRYPNWRPEATVLPRAWPTRPRPPDPLPYPAQGGRIGKPRWPRTTFNEWRRGRDKARHSLVPSLRPISSGIVWTEARALYPERDSGEVPGMAQVITQSVDRTGGRKQLPKR
jgi:hypothetical protein